MKTRNHFLSRLHIRLSLSFLLLSLLSICTLSALIYGFASRILLRENMQRTEASVRQSADYIAAYMDKLKAFSTFIAMHPDIGAALAQSDRQAAGSVFSLIQLAQNSDSRIRSIAVVSKNGFAITGGSDMAMPLSPDMMQQEWYKNALQSGQMPVLATPGQGIFAMDDNDWFLSLCTEINDASGQHLGVVIIDLSYHFIEDYLHKLSLGDKGYAYIIDSEANMVYHPVKDLFRDKEAIRSLQQKEAGLQKTGEIIYKIPVPNTTWTLFGLSSSDNVRALQQQLIRSIFMAAGFLLILTFVFALLLSDYLSKPIRRLKNAMKSAGENWEHISVSRHSSHEVISLSEEYNHMLDRIRNLTENIAQTEKARRLFELRALQSQINPHFLYNTLDSILWLAELGEQENVVKVSAALGKMLRLSLHMEQSFVSLQAELEHLQNYLAIQKIRYEDILQYEIYGDASLIERSVPKLILQPLAENAIYHGIREKSGGGKILVHYYAQDETLFIEVSDDGVGFDPDKLPERKVQKDKKLGGIGLQNVEQRIKLLCGREYGMQICSAEGEGTRIVLRLPLLP